MLQYKIKFLGNRIDNIEYIPLRVLSLREVHLLLSKICLGLFLVHEQGLCLNKKVIELEKLEQNTENRDEIDLRHFKISVMSLFGANLFHLSLIDLDTILRTIHQELLISEDKND